MKSACNRLSLKHDAISNGFPSAVTALGNRFTSRLNLLPSFQEYRCLFYSMLSWL